MKKVLKLLIINVDDFVSDCCFPITACTGGQECGTEDDLCDGTIDCGTCVDECPTEAIEL